MRSTSLKASALFSLLTAVASLSSDARPFPSCPQRQLVPPPCLSPGGRVSIHGSDDDKWTAAAGNKSKRRRMTATTTAAPSSSVSSSSPATTSPAIRGSSSSSSRLRTPLVDSNLLRFLHGQKQKTQDEEDCPDIAAAQAPSSRPSAAGVRPTTATYLQIDSDVVSSSPPLVPVTSATSVSAALESLSSASSSQSSAVSVWDRQQQQQQQPHQAYWMGQFHRDRVANTLLDACRTHSKGNNNCLDVGLAMRAGERVQGEAMARSARRQVRAFLQQRDRAWRVDRTTTSASTSATMDTKLPKRLHPIQEAAVDVNVGDVTIDSKNSNHNNNIKDIVDVFLEYGLTVKDVAEILVHTPGLALMRPRPRDIDADNNTNSNIVAAAGSTLAENMDRVFIQLLTRTLGLRKYDARRVIRTTPSLLTLRGSRNAQQMVAMLSRLGVSTNALARDKTSLPALLARSPAAVFRLVAFLSSDAVRMPMNKIGPLLRRSECQTLMNLVAPVVLTTSGSHFAENDVDQAHRETTATARANPTPVTTFTCPGTSNGVLWPSVGGSYEWRERVDLLYRGMSNTAWSLRNQIGAADLSKVIAAYPSVLLLNAETQILPTAHYLMHELGIWEDDLPRVLQLYPALLGVELDHMRQVVSYLLSLEVPQENLASIFRSFPSLLTLSVDTHMGPVVNFLRGSVGISNVGRFISRLPPVLGYSVQDEMLPKWTYLSSLVSDPRFEVSRFPAYFSYPLERVIKTRFDYLRRIKGLPRPLMTAGSLDQVLRYGDKDFAMQVAGDRDDGVAFANFIVQQRQLQQDLQHHPVREQCKAAAKNNATGFAATVAATVAVAATSTTSTS